MGAVQNEILRIQQEEEWVAVDGDEKVIPPDIPHGRPIYVCGAYLELCVQEQYDALLRAGYQACIWGKGTVALGMWNKR